MSITNVNKSELIVRVSHELKKVADVKPPAWSIFVKTGCQAERPPANRDWWFVRAASLLLKIQLLGPVGVSKLRIQYGGKRNRGMAPEQFRQAGGKILRLLCQQLERAGFVKQGSKKLHKGRVITQKGLSFVERVSYQMMKEANLVLPSKTVHTPQEKVLKSEPAMQGSEQKSEGVVEAKPGEEVKAKKPRAPRKQKKTETPEEVQGNG